eukprot:jgi/Chrpa1/16745/Chrysochromulina_OHIO_Genome00009434-RA
MRMMLNTINSDSADLQAELGIPALNLSVELTGTGEVAWDLMRAKRFDIALIDLNLPGVSGQDLSWCVKQGSVEAHDDEQLSTSHKVASHETILIACTADDKEHSAALAAYGLHDLLYKPVSVMDLRHVLHKWLPRTGVSAVQQLPQLEQPASLQRNRSGVFAGRVLLVEDDAITRFASELVFQELGLRVDTAEDAHSAMANLAKHDYDLLLLLLLLRLLRLRRLLRDVHLPDLSGYALCSWYRAMCRTEGRAMAYVCAVTADPELETCREFEFDQCLPKPLSTPTIVQALREFWGRAHCTNAIQKQLDAMQLDQLDEVLEPAPLTPPFLPPQPPKKEASSPPEPAASSPGVIHAKTEE